MGAMLGNAIAYALERARRRWVTLADERIVVAAMDEVTVGVSLDAAFLGSGDFQSLVRIDTNDPLRPTETVPVQLSVLSSPDLVVSSESFDLGDVFLGGRGERTLRVTNAGTEILTVDAEDAPPFFVSPLAITVDPGASAELVVGFAPEELGSHDTELTLATNDPDRPAVGLSLSGRGLAAPVISINPTSLEESLASGELVERVIQITNDGGNDLVWQADIDTDGNGKTARDLAGLRVVFDRAHGQNSWRGWSTARGDLQTRGAELEESFLPWSMSSLAEVDVLWVTDFAVFPTAAELDALRTWLLAGGGLLLEGDDTTTVNRFNQVLSNVGGVAALLGPERSRRRQRRHRHPRGHARRASRASGGEPRPRGPARRACARRGLRSGRARSRGSRSTGARPDRGDLERAVRRHPRPPWPTTAA